MTDFSIFYLVPLCSFVAFINKGIYVNFMSEIEEPFLILIPQGEMRISS